VPLAAPKNGFLLLHSLELDASVRYERYSDFGSTTKPKFGFSWKPFTWVMVRGSVNKGFRAPDLADLYQPASFTVASPPGNRDAVRTNFFTGAGLPSDAQVLNKTYTLGNPDLGPEESKGRSVGIAVEIPKVKGLSVTVDYWEIEQNNLIISQTRDSSVDEALLRAFTQSQLAAGKPIGSIDTGSRTTPDGPNTYVGDPYTLRAPVTDADRATFAAANAVLPASRQLAPVGVWIGTTSKFVNSTGRNFTNGFDFGVNYSLPRTRFGQFRVSTEWSKFLNKYTKTLPTSPKDDDIISMILPAWRGSANVQWRKGPWSATLNGTYTAEVRTGANTNAATYASLGSPNYIRPFFNNGAQSYYERGRDQIQLNSSVSYRFGPAANFWLRSTTVRLGVNNLLDTPPNRTATAAGYNGGLGTSLWVGRAYTVTVTRAF
jgi:outer membrane receptor protein involved in Fe transport